MIYDPILDELNSRETYKYETYAPFYICSYAVHSFNLMNQKKEIYWEGKKVPNMRLHLLNVAPPGFMKSHYMWVMGGDTYSIFKGGGTMIGFEQSMTEAGFVGTIVNSDGIANKLEGAAETFLEGVLLIDEFSAITTALKNQINSQLDTQLLAALDHGNVVKRLSSGKIQYQTLLTLWAGIQPARYDLTSGLGRRLCFLLFMPTREDNDALLRAMHRARNIKPNIREMDKLWGKIAHFNSQIDIIERLEYSDSVLKMYEDLGLYSYESSYFDRLMLGYYLATRGPEKKIVIDTTDKELRRMLTVEKGWRDSISFGIDFVQLMRIIESLGGKITKRELISEASMVGWSAQQVHEMTLQMIQMGMIKKRNDIIEIIEDGTDGRKEG